MKTLINIKVNKKAASKLRAGYPLLEKEVIQNPKALKEEGDILRILGDKKNYIGTGYCRLDYYPGAGRTY